MYSVELSQKANDYFEKLDSHLKERIRKGLKKLENNPVPKDAKFCGRHEGEKVFRARIGDYRALYKVNKVKEAEKIVLVTRIDKRPRVYGR